MAKPAPERSADAWRCRGVPSAARTVAVCIAPEKQKNESMFLDFLKYAILLDMFKRMSVSFHDEIMQIISVFTLLPLCLVAVSFFIFSYIYFDTVTLAQNRRDNREIAGVFGDIISIYEKKLHSVTFDFDVEELKNDSSMSRYFLSSMIQFMNRQGHSADFFLFDSKFNTVTSSSPLLISFVPPDTGKNWGIVKRNCQMLWMKNLEICLGCNL